MKLATLRDGSRDGRLVVVSPDLAWCADASPAAPTLQAALDDWARAEPKLRDIAVQLDHRSVPVERFHEHDCESPLPRAYQWADGSAYINHVELVRRARGVEVPASFYSDPLMYQGGSDGFLGPRDAIPFGDASWGFDLEGEVAVITGDVPMGAGVDAAADAVRLVMLCNDVSLRGLIPGELAKGFGFFHGKPASAFSPVAVTPDELGTMWDGRKLSATLRVDVNGKPFGRVETGEDLTFDFVQLIAHAARTRKLAAGTIIGSGTVSNKGADGGPGLSVGDGGRGYACLAELRTVQMLATGEAATPFLGRGDTVRIEVLDAHGHSVFGAIEQMVG
jgi:fumarylacetoacetate (FAA) hydrolase